MSKSNFLLIVLAGFVFIQNIIAQEDTPLDNDLLSFYDNELFTWEYKFNNFNLNYKNQTSVIAFGINSIMADALKKYPDTAQYYNSYRRTNIAGNILLWGGFSTAIGGILLSPVFLFGVNDRELGRNLTIGFILSGFVAELMGVFILPSGYKALVEGINIYNRHKIEEYALKNGNNSDRSLMNNIEQ